MLEFQWCGEWRSKTTSGTSVKLYQLPNGQHIYPDDVRGVLPQIGKVVIRRTLEQTLLQECKFFCATMACTSSHATRKKPPKPCDDKIAADVNAMVGVRHSKAGYAIDSVWWPDCFVTGKIDNNRPEIAHCADGLMAWATAWLATNQQSDFGRSLWCTNRPAITGSSPQQKISADECR